MKSIRYLISIGVLIVYATLLCIHFVIKDNYNVTSILFYASPTLIVLIFGIILYVVFKSNKLIRIILTITSLFLLGYWVLTNFNFSCKYSSAENKSYTILFWNVAQNSNYNLNEISKLISKRNFDIIVLVEAYHKNNPNNKTLEQILKSYNISHTHHYTIEYLHYHTIIAHKGKRVKINNLGGDFHVLSQLTIEIDNKEISIGVADVYADPFLFRKESLNEIINHAENKDINILLGDFNTPYQSVHFENFKKNYTNMRAYQKGYLPTWPKFFPLFELDQIWIQKDLKSISLEKQFKKRSDHALLIANFICK